jgi:hypothetical protein
VVITAAMALLTAGAATAGSPGPNRLASGATALLMGAVVLTALPAIIRQAFRHEKVTVNTLAAAVVAYLFIGFFFTSAFRLIGVVEDVPFFSEVSAPHAGIFQYFSFITLTTTGYGDFTAATDAGRAAALLEAVVGQVFLVTAVARIVSLLGQRQGKGAEPEDDYYT